MKNSRCKRCI